MDGEGRRGFALSGIIGVKEEAEIREVHRIGLEGGQISGWGG